MKRPNGEPLDLVEVVETIDTLTDEDRDEVLQMVLVAAYPTLIAQEN